MKLRLARLWGAVRGGLCRGVVEGRRNSVRRRGCDCRGGGEALIERRSLWDGVQKE